MGQMEMKRFIGVDIGGTKCAVTVGDENCRVIEKVKFLTDGSALDRIITEAKKFTEKYDISSVGISCGGPLDSSRGVICSPPNLLGWNEIPITLLLSEATGVPAKLCNDADACALAEWRFGAGKGTKNMVFLTFGTGMGAGLILDGHLYTGACNMAGEVGHIRLSGIGPVGYGKAGSFEGFCSGGGIKRLAQAVIAEKISRGEDVPYSMDDISLIDAKFIAEKAEEGDPTAREIFRISGEKLGEALAVIIDILNPEMIVIGSIFQRSGGLLREAMEEALRREAIDVSRRACRIVPAALGDDIGDIAALAVAQ